MDDNKNILYGIVLDKPITPPMACDALVQCFFEAHCADADTGTDDSTVNGDYIKNIVKKSFMNSGGDFENPTKQSIFNAMGKLQDFAKNFRDQSIVQKHAGEMMRIVEKIN